MSKERPMKWRFWLGWEGGVSVGFWVRTWYNDRGLGNVLLVLVENDGRTIGILRACRLLGLRRVWSLLLLAPLPARQSIW